MYAFAGKNFSTPQIPHIQAAVRFPGILRKHYASMYRLPRVNQRGETGIISAVVKILRLIVSFLIYKNTFSGIYRNCRRFQASAAAMCRLVCIADTAFSRDRILLIRHAVHPNLHGMRRSREFKMTAVNSFLCKLLPRLRKLFPRKLICHFPDIQCSIGNIHDV